MLEGRVRPGRLTICLFVLTLVSALLRPSSCQTTWGMAYELTARLTAGTVEWVIEAMGATDMCPFASEFTTVAKKVISEKILCQDRAMDAISQGLGSWELNLKDKNSRPLVLAMTGPTGVGKTETAQVLARAILTKNELESGRPHPRGLLMLRGEDYSDPRGNSTFYVDRIKGAIFAKAKKCQGHGIIIFDEIQKVVPGTLEALVEAISERPMISYYAPDGTLQHYDTSKFIFVLISDIGLPEMMTLLLQHDDPDEIPSQKLADAVRKALNSQWDRLKFSKHVDKVVPFLPLAKPQLRKILDLKLKEKSEARSGDLWARLDVSEEVRDYLVEKPFIKYECYYFDDEEDRETAEQQRERQLQAEEERRRTAAGNGGGDGSVSTSSPITNDKNNNRCAKGKGRWYAEFGARNLEIGGPLQALDSAIVESIKPWRPLQVLDVRFNKAMRHVELRWCAEEATGSSGDRTCELMWTGDLSKKIP